MWCISTQCLPSGLAAQSCEQNHVNNSVIEPHLSVVYAAGQEFCMEPVTQEGTVIAVLQCLLDHPGRATLTGYSRNVYRLHRARNGSATVFYLTIRQRGLRGAPTIDQITLSCLLCSASSNPVVVNITYCSESTQSAAPYVLGVPPTSTIMITEDQITDVPLFNVIAGVSAIYFCMHSLAINKTGNFSCNERSTGSITQDVSAA